MHTKGERSCGSYVRSTCRAKRHPGRGLAPNANDEGGRQAPTTRVTRGSAARLAPPALPPTAPIERGWFSSIVTSREDTRWTVRRRPARAEEFSISTVAQRERAPRVPMRLAQGTSRPSSIAACQATSRVAVTAEQHLRPPTPVERWPDVRRPGRVCQRLSISPDVKKKA